MDSKPNYEIAIAHLKNNQYNTAHNLFLNFANSMKKSDIVRAGLLFLLAAECKVRQERDSSQEMENAANMFLQYGNKKNVTNTRTAFLCASKCFLNIGQFDLAKKTFDKSKTAIVQHLQLSRPVVIIEDSKAISLKIRSYVEKLGYDEIYVFENGLGGLKGCKKLLSENKLPIILLDMGLPDVDGDIVATKLFDEESALQIIVITADEKTTKRVKKTISSGVSAFIQKPFTFDEFKKAVDLAEREYSL